MKSLLLCSLGFAVLLSSCSTAPKEPPLTSVDKVDLPRYLGTWYEIARYPNRFEKDLTHVTATYTLKPDGNIEVLNQGTGPDGPKKAIGKARAVPDAAGAKLKVSFFGPFEANYWVIAIDEKNYQWAIVGEPGRNYLWILSRSRTLPKGLYENLLKKVKALGYDPAKLQPTPQRG